MPGFPGGLQLRGRGDCAPNRVTESRTKASLPVFSDTVIYNAAHVIYSSEFADALERRGGSFGGGVDVCTVVDPLTPAEHDPIVRPLLAKIDRALGVPLADIFTAGGIVDEDAQEDALGDLLLGVRGHGVSIEDDYSEAWQRGCEALGVTADLPYDEMTEYADLANAKLDAAGYPPEPEDGQEPDPSYEPIIATAFSWHGGQESAMYAFASTRTVQSEEHKAALLAEIAEDIAWHDSNAEQTPGDVEKLKRLEAAIKRATPGAKFFYC